MKQESFLLDPGLTCVLGYPSRTSETKLYGECVAHSFPQRQRIASRRELPNVQVALLILRLQLELTELRHKVQELSRRVTEFEELPQPLLLPINTFAPRPFEPTKQIVVLVEPVVDESGEACEYIATFPDAGIGATGDTVEEAISLLKGRMVTEYTLLGKLPPKRLGNIPRQQFAALQAVMRRNE